MGKPKKTSVKRKGKEEASEPPLVEDGDSIYVPECSVCKKDSLKKSSICHESIYHLATPADWMGHCHGRHLGFVAGYKYCDARKPIEACSKYFNLDSEKGFIDDVHEMERLNFPYLLKVSKCFGQPLSVLQGLESDGLKKELSEEVLRLSAGKRSFGEVGDVAASRDIGSSLHTSDEASKKRLDLSPWSQRMIPLSLLPLLQVLSLVMMVPV
ncbi:hypothetical protein L1987_01779 [Smallanthus sonchifolius]|uniref:Uncharacterized protein n=1 Tax=Smallanthus sonchifolius TaxID=185202 RepID=A0ACB9K664_9ASTR|nr:hypothetical protein L1987_01779 [Smallanthus sonchifolius]